MDHLRQVLHTLQSKKFYVNLKKCAICTDRIIFLGFVISSERVSVDPEKVKAITKWPQPWTIRKIRSFYELATFYRMCVCVYVCEYVCTCVYLHTCVYVLYLCVLQL